MTTVAENITAETTDLLATYFDAEQDRANAEKLVQAAKKIAKTAADAIELRTFGCNLTDDDKLARGKDNLTPIPGTQHALYYRDYGKPSLASVLKDLVAWCGANKTLSVHRIVGEIDRLKSKHTKPSYKLIVVEHDHRLI